MTQSRQARAPLHLRIAVITMALITTILLVVNAVFFIRNHDALLQNTYEIQQAQAQALSATPQTIVQGSCRDITPSNLLSEKPLPDGGLIVLGDISNAGWTVCIDNHKPLQASLELTGDEMIGFYSRDMSGANTDDLTIPLDLTAGEGFSIGSQAGNTWGVTAILTLSPSQKIGVVGGG